jgi:hypothetical protein
MICWSCYFRSFQSDSQMMLSWFVVSLVDCVLLCDTVVVKQAAMWGFIICAALLIGNRHAYLCREYKDLNTILKFGSYFNDGILVIIMGLILLGCILGWMSIDGPWLHNTGSWLHVLHWICVWESSTMAALWCLGWTTQQIGDLRLEAQEQRMLLVCIQVEDEHRVLC